MYSSIQRVGDRYSGGVMTDLKTHIEWPCECPPKVAWRVGWNGCLRYKARVSEIRRDFPVLED